MAETNGTVSSNNDKGWTPEEWVNIEAETMDDDAFADRIFEQLEAAPALIDKQKMYVIESNIQKDQMRRAAFAMAALTGGDLCNKIEEDRGFAVLTAGVFAELKSTKERYKELLGIFEALEGRLMIALCSREDMEAVIEEGKTALFN